MRAIGKSPSPFSESLLNPSHLWTPIGRRVGVVEPSLLGCFLSWIQTKAAEQALLYNSIGTSRTRGYGGDGSVEPSLLGSGFRRGVDPSARRRARSCRSSYSCEVAGKEPFAAMAAPTAGWARSGSSGASSALRQQPPPLS